MADAFEMIARCLRIQEQAKRVPMPTAQELSEVTLPPQPFELTPMPGGPAPSDLGFEGHRPITSDEGGRGAVADGEGGIF